MRTAKSSFFIGMTLTVCALCGCGKSDTENILTDTSSSEIVSEEMSLTILETEGLHETSGVISVAGNGEVGNDVVVGSVLTSTANGNSTGNLNNSGIVVENGGKIYYYNQSENKALYVMNSDGSNAKALGNITGATALNVVGDYIYYLSSGIYKASITNGEVTNLSKDSCRNLVVNENGIYYLKAESDSTKVYHMNLDGSNDTVVSENIASALNVTSNKIYYINGSDSGKIYSMDLDGSNDELVVDTKNVKELLVEDGFIYYIGSDDKLMVTMEGSDEKSEVSKDKISNINIYNNMLYYYNVTNSTLCTAMADGSEETILYSGELRAINVISEWIYFFNNDDSSYYRISTDGNNCEIVD